VLFLVDEPGAGLPDLARRYAGAANMDQLTITCPKCSEEIRLTESLAAPLLAATRKQYESKLAAKDAEVEQRESELRKREKALKEKQASIDDQVAERLQKERRKVAEEEAKRARLAVAGELEAKESEVASLQESLKSASAKVTRLSKAQADLMRRERELEAERETLALSVEKEVREKLDEVKSQARREAEDSLRLKVSEKEQQISGMQKTIDELKRRAEQGSQQLQGEVLELDLEKLLASSFPMDRIEPVPKGEFGGDTLHRVVGPLGQACGTILWESKRTKNWSDGWLQKLRNDQRLAKAELAVLVSQSLPKGMETFGLMDGVWVAHTRAAIPVAFALRHSLIEVSLARRSSEGQHTKMALIYDYLVGPRFRHRVQAIVESFTSMKEDLDKERRLITKQWAKREEQITRVMESTVGMYGDLQGIAGSSLAEVDGLDLDAGGEGPLLIQGEAGE
jgi:hypothetical protein